MLWLLAKLSRQCSGQHLWQGLSFVGRRCRVTRSHKVSQGLALGMIVIWRCDGAEAIIRRRSALFVAESWQSVLGNGDRFRSTAAGALYRRLENLDVRRSVRCSRSTMPEAEQQPAADGHKEHGELALLTCGSI